MVSRNSSLEYGNYYGSTGLYKLNSENGEFTGTYSYSIPPVDMVDNLARTHDKGYDALGAIGAGGLLSDWGTTPVDEAASSGWKNFLDNYKVGDNDPFNNQRVTRAERWAARKGSLFFDEIVKGKKLGISNFMDENYSSSEEKRPPQSPEEFLQRIEDNYKAFVDIYLEKGDDGRLIRKDGMWTKGSDDVFKPKPNP